MCFFMQRMDPIEFKNWLERRTKEFAVQTFKLLDAMPKIWSFGSFVT